MPVNIRLPDRSPATMQKAIDVRAPEAELRSTIRGEVRFDNGTRAIYSTDASNYRQIPIDVVIPRSREDVIETVAVCRRHGAPVLARGGGTSIPCRYPQLPEGASTLASVGGQVE